MHLLQRCSPSWTERKQPGATWCACIKNMLIHKCVSTGDWIAGVYVMFVLKQRDRAEAAQDVTSACEAPQQCECSTA